MYEALTGPFGVDSAPANAGLMATDALASEPWRCVTALTLHADAQHLATNAVLGCALAGILSRRTGLGVAVAVAVAGGAAGNALDAYVLAPSTPWVGASTAVFALMGALCATYRSLTMVALSALLGFGAALTPGINHGAHACGWFAGLVLGLVVRRDDDEPVGLALQLGALGAAAFAVAACWGAALQQ